MSTNLEQSSDWQTRSRGTNDNEYQIYVDCAKSLGWEIKSYDEWINS